MASGRMGNVELQTAVRDAILACDRAALDLLIVQAVMLAGSPQETGDAIVKTMVATIGHASEDVQRYWMDDVCDCCTGGHHQN